MKHSMNQRRRSLIALGAGTFITALATELTSGLAAHADGEGRHVRTRVTRRRHPDAETTEERVRDRENIRDEHVAERVECGEHGAGAGEAAEPEHPRPQEEILVVAGVGVCDPVVGRGVPRAG